MALQGFGTVNPWFTRNGLIVAAAVIAICVPILRADDRATTPRSGPTVKPTPAAGLVDRNSLTYDGKPFEYWHKLLVNELKPDLRLKPLQAVIAFGPNGYAEQVTEDLIKVLNGYSKIDEEKIGEMEQGNGSGPEVSPEMVTAYLTMVTKAMNPNAVVPAAGFEHPQARLIADRELMTIAAEGLLKTASAASPAILRAAADRSTHGLGRRSAIMVLAQSPGDPKAAAALLLRIVGDPQEDAEISSTAIDALAELQLAPDECLPALNALTRSKDPKRREQGINAIGQMKESARDAILTLTTALDDSNPRIVVAAANALAQVDPPGSKTAPALLKVLPRLRESETIDVFRRLDAMGLFAAYLAGESQAFDVSAADFQQVALIPTYVQMLKVSSVPNNVIAGTCRPLIQILADMGPKASATLEALDAIAADKAQPKERREAATTAIARIKNAKR